MNREPRNAKEIFEKMDYYSSPEMKTGKTYSFPTITGRVLDLGSIGREREEKRKLLNESSLLTETPLFYF